MNERMPEERGTVDPILHAGPGRIEQPEQRGTVGDKPIEALGGLAVFPIRSAQGDDLSVAELDG
jgi:hypothetical protein